MSVRQHSLLSIGMCSSVSAKLCGLSPWRARNHWYRWKTRRQGVGTCLVDGGFYWWLENICFFLVDVSFSWHKINCRLWIMLDLVTSISFFSWSDLSTLNRLVHCSPGRQGRIGGWTQWLHNAYIVFSCLRNVALKSWWEISISFMCIIINSVMWQA